MSKVANLDITITALREGWGEWCNEYTERLNELNEAQAAIRWLIENDGSWTMDDDIPEGCRSIICAIRDQMYSASAKPGVV